MYHRLLISGNKKHVELCMKLFIANGDLSISKFAKNHRNCGNLYNMIINNEVCYSGFKKSEDGAGWEIVSNNNLSIADCVIYLSKRFPNIDFHYDKEENIENGFLIFQYQKYKNGKLIDENEWYSFDFIIPQAESKEGI